MKERLVELSSLVQQGENVEAVECADRLMADECTVEEIIEALSKGIEVLRDKCTVENFQLLDVLLASRAMVEVVDGCVANKLQKEMDVLAEAFEKTRPDEVRRTIVIGAIQGDPHDLGIHIVGTLCRFSNFNVVNLGKNVPVETFINTAIGERADFVGVSSLMTACLPKIKEIRPALEKKGFGDITVVGGGSSVLQSSTDALNLDYVAHDAFDGLDFFLNPIQQTGY